jgi:hypothetical protein
MGGEVAWKSSPPRRRTMCLWASLAPRSPTVRCAISLESSRRIRLVPRRPTLPSVKSETLIFPVSPALLLLEALRRSLPARSTKTIFPNRWNCHRPTPHTATQVELWFAGSHAWPILVTSSALCQTSTDRRADFRVDALGDEVEEEEGVAPARVLVQLVGSLATVGRAFVQDG